MNRAFIYTNAVNTNVVATFARARALQSPKPVRLVNPTGAYVRKSLAK